MKLVTGFLLVAVCFPCSSIVQANPYVTEWWSKGVATVTNFVLGPAPAPWHEEATRMIEFDPEAGPRKAPNYQRHFGPRGEHLVQLLGSGGYRSRNNHMQISRHDGGPWMDAGY